MFLVGKCEKCKVFEGSVIWAMIHGMKDGYWYGWKLYAV